MQQPADKMRDERFWASFAACSEQLAETAKEPDLPVGWWEWPFLRRAEELSTRIPTSAPSDSLAVQNVARVTISALLVCEKKPHDFTVAIRHRIAVVRELVEQKGKDYNAGGVSIFEYWPEGTSNIIYEIRKRALRLLSVARSEQQPQPNEIAEIGLDIAAFSLFLLAYIQSAPSSVTPE